MICVNNEIMPLEKVILHRPGNELLNMTSDNLKKFLYDDIPYLKIAREEHDEFAKMLRISGVTVIYLEDLMAETLELNPEIKEKFIRQYVFEAGIRTPKYRNSIIKFLMEFNSSKELVLKTMEGVNINELSKMELDMDHSLVDLVVDDGKFLIDPMPNLVFMRDTASVIGNGISLNKMAFRNRERESIYFEYIFNYHPNYKDVTKHYEKYNSYSVEGGDILVIDKHTLLMGITQRTEASAIEELAINIFKDSKIDTIIALTIPNTRAYMHLDTVITQIDYDKFLYYAGIVDSLSILEIKDDNGEGIKVKKINDNLERVLEKYLKRDITLIPCGGGDKIISEREQWNDGVNVLCVSPGVVVSYDRNNITNAVLRRYGIKVLEIRSSEISRGRGGPRCMCMPLNRNNK